VPVRVRPSLTSSRFLGWIVVLVAAVAIVFGAAVTVQSGQKSATPHVEAVSPAVHRQVLTEEGQAVDHGWQTVGVASVSPPVPAAQVSGGFSMTPSSGSDHGPGDGSCPLLAAACMIALMVVLVSWRLRRPGTSVIRILPRMATQVPQVSSVRYMPAARSPLMFGISLT
jgi:hypothetical protein